MIKSKIAAVFLFCAGLLCLAQAQVPMTGAGTGAPGGGVTPLSQWVAAVIAAGGTVSGTQQTRVGTLITALQGHGIFTVWDGLWLLDSENPTQASIDIVNRNTWTSSGSVTQAATGYTSATGGQLRTSLNLSMTTNYTRNSATLMGYVTVADSSGAGSTLMGAGDGAVWGTIKYDVLGVRANGGINITQNDFNTVTGTHNNGLIVSVRNGSGTTNDFTSVTDSSGVNAGGSSGDASSAPPNFALWFLALNGSGAPANGWNGTLAIAGIGSQLSTGQIANLCTDVNNGYLAARGHSLFTC